MWDAWERYPTEDDEEDIEEDDGACSSPEKSATSATSATSNEEPTKGAAVVPASGPPGTIREQVGQAIKGMDVSLDEALGFFDPLDLEQIESGVIDAKGIRQNVLHGMARVRA